MNLRKEVPGTFDFGLDIGANIGIFTIYFKTLFPTIKVIALEPDKETFKCLEKNTSFIPGIYRENRAFGDGKKIILKTRICALDRYCVPSEEGETTMTMKDIFAKYKILPTHRYIIKSDCEGGEKYFVGDNFTENMIRNAKIFFMECHFNSTQTNMFPEPWKFYNDWIQGFKKTHTIKYFMSSRKRGYGHYLLERL
jgi:FkbM family methyltransferase